jgi:uncharacterized protein
MTPAEIRAVVERYVDGRARNDAGQLAALLHEEIEFHPPPSMLRPVSGRETVARMWADWPPKLWEPATIKYRLDDVIVEGERAVVLQRITATTTGGEPYENDYAFVLTFRDGLIHRVDEFVDSLYAARAFGTV